MVAHLVSALSNKSTFPRKSFVNWLRDRFWCPGNCGTADALTSGRGLRTCKHDNWEGQTYSSRLWVLEAGRLVVAAGNSAGALRTIANRLRLLTAHSIWVSTGLIPPPSTGWVILKRSSAELLKDALSDPTFLRSVRWSGMRRATPGPPAGQPRPGGFPQILKPTMWAPTTFTAECGNLLE